MKLTEQQIKGIRYIEKCEAENPGEDHYIPYEYLFDLIPLKKRNYFFQPRGYGCYEINKELWPQLLEMLPKDS